MNSVWANIFFLLFMSVVLAIYPDQSTFAQPVDSTSQSSSQVTKLQPFTNPHEFTIWLGIAFDSYSLWGKTPDTRNQSMGIGYNRKLTSIDDAILEYNTRIDLYSNYSYPVFNSSGQRSSLSGLGISPLGFQLNFRTSKSIQPFLNTSAGILFLEHPFPDFRGKKLNFTLSAGGGLEINLSNSVSVSLGIKYHHLSNGDRGQVNPGIDSNIYYTSITIF